ncbi:MAG: OmpA family protein [Treponema sp.]|nr:OmpA family protein [Treponema sp.]
MFKRNKAMRAAICFCALFVFGAALFAADTQFVYSGSQNYSLVERTDLRRYDNGKYVGLMSREARSFIVCEDGVYDGDFFVHQDTVHNQKIVVNGIHDSIRSVFKISKDGTLTMIEDNGYPSFRSFPTFPQKKIQQGQSWQARAVRAMDPLSKGRPTRVPIYVEYTYLRDEVFGGQEVYVLSARWATRYGYSEVDPNGDPDLLRANGSNNATMYIRKADCAALVIRDSVDELYEFSDGSKVAFKGTISLFTEYPPAIDRTKLLPAINRVAAADTNAGGTVASAKGGSSGGSKSSGATGGGEDRPPLNESKWLEKVRVVGTSGGAGESSVKIKETAGGIMLTLENLHFKPDSAQLLPGEAALLDKIASILKETGQNKLLVNGHTASVGNPSGEMALSIERAKEVAAQLCKRGIDADKFICRGSGSKYPVADNSTKEGMAQNRRVEITILE